MDKECLEVQCKTLQCQRGLETVDESGIEEKSGGAASDVLPADSRPRESLLPSLPDADSERRTSGGLAGTAAVKCGGATAAVAVVTKVGEVGWVGRVSVLIGRVVWHVSGDAVFSRNGCDSWVPWRQTAGSLGTEGALGTSLAGPRVGTNPSEEVGWFAWSGATRSNHQNHARELCNRPLKSHEQAPLTCHK